MQKPHRFSRNVALTAVAAFALIICSFARADDVSKNDDKSIKQDAASASKVDLSTPASKLNFYGEAETGVYASTFKSNCSKTQHASGMYSDIMVGTRINLTSSITMGIQVQAGRGVAAFR